MSTTATTDVLDRTMHDEDFLDWFLAAPDAALAAYGDELTDGEAAALADGDEARIRERLGDLALATAVVVIVVGLPW